MALNNLKRQVRNDDEGDVEPDAPASTAQAAPPAPAAVAPGHVAPAATASLGGDFPGFEGVAAGAAEPAPAIAAPAAAAAPTFSDMVRAKAGEAAIAPAARPGRMGGFAQPAGGEDHEDAPAHAPAGAGTVDLDGMTAHDPAIDGSPGADPAAAPESLYYKGAENVIDIVQNLVRSGGLGVEESYKLSRDWNDYIQSVPRQERITGISTLEKELNELKARDLERQGAAAAANGGGLGSLLGSMMGGRGNNRRQDRVAKKVDSAKAEAVAADVAAAERMRERLFETKQNRYNQDMLELGCEVNGLARAIRNYNDAFLDCPEAAALRAAVEAEAARSDTTVAEVMESVGRGDASPKIMAEYKKIREAGLAERNAEVRKARDQMEERERAVHEGFRKSAREAQSMHDNFQGLQTKSGNRFDIDTYKESIDQALDMLPASLPTPITDSDAAAKLSKRLAEMTTAIQETMSKFFQTLTERFMGPK